MDIDKLLTELVDVYGESEVTRAYFRSVRYGKPMLETLAIRAERLANRPLDQDCTLTLSESLTWYSRRLGGMHKLLARQR